ncbi:MAG: MarR family transcriptional regulator [Woeseiaceae bacterium]
MDRDKAYETTWLIRRLFRAMASLADAYLHSADLTAADRAVMEFLFADNKLTVPEIATRYQVSRQHVQVTVNGLLQKGLLESQANPRHKRSPLIALSDLGRASFAEIRRNETEQLDRLFENVAASDLQTTNTTLRSLYDQLR